MTASIVFGGHKAPTTRRRRAYLQHEIDWIRDHVDAGGRYLGICLGGQLLARALEARVARHRDGIVEIGYYAVTPTEKGRDLFPDSLHVYHWHQEGFEVPEGASAAGPWRQCLSQPGVPLGQFGLRLAVPSGSHRRCGAGLAGGRGPSPDRRGAQSRDHQEAQMRR